MASQVLSGATNASYTNNTGQNVRLIINYMSNVTSMTWADVTVTASSTTIGKNVPISYSATNFSMILPTGTLNASNTSASNDAARITLRGTVAYITGAKTATGQDIPAPATGTLNLTPSTNSNFPIELMLANGQTFSAVCGAYNIISIKEDGT
jgi:hypothetical protein